ncbi:MAG: site-specific DNA-methyltransferase [Aestuariivirga sp.]|nr:site-specific DNA-methyltransferase [Aestuariivirga sp.]
MTKKQHNNKLHSESNKKDFSHTIFDVHVDLLKPPLRNARTHSKKQIRQIAASIRKFGFLTPLLIDGDGTVVAGNGRLAAVRMLGMESVPCILVSHLSKAEVRALAIADNRTAELAGWDADLLALELQEIKLLDVDFDLDVIGFSAAEVDHLIEGLAPEESGNPADDALPPLEPEEVITRTGDVWIMGNHRLVCGDALSTDVVATLMAGARARMVFTDPPYNLKVSTIGGLGRVKHREFAMASGEMGSGEFTRFLTDACKMMATNCIDGAIAFICMDWRHLDELSAAGREAFTEMKNLIVWSKSNGGMGSFYRSSHELIFCYKVGTAAHLNTFELGQHGRYRTNVWNYRGVNSFGSGRNEALAMHPTAKPVEMLADAMKDVSKRGDIVLDLFGGSGSTLIAAQKAARRAHLCEIDAAYCDRIVRRWQAYAKDDAILEATGQTFDEVAADRSNGTAAQAAE